MSKVVVISFDHVHAGDPLQMGSGHPQVELADIFGPHPASMANPIAAFGMPADRIFADFDACM